MLFAFIGLVPVVLFLSLLLALDSFKLVKGSAIAAAIGWGAAAALIAAADHSRR